MTKRFEVVWEAHHDQDARFGGALFGTGVVCLAYSGRLKRSGMLSWQKTRLQDLAELHLVRYRDDEPVWAAELGGDLPIASLTPDQVYRALETTPLAVAPEVVLCRHTWADDVWYVHALDAATGAPRWQRPAVEPLKSQVDTGAGFMVCVQHSGPAELVALGSGEVVGSLEGLPVEPDAVAAGGIVLADGEDGRVHAFSAVAEAIWSVDAPGLTTGHLGDVVAAAGSGVVIAQPGAIRLVDARTGEVRWRAEGLPGPRLAVRVEGDFLALEDASSNRALILSQADGRLWTSGQSPDILHWCHAGPQMALVTLEGELHIVDVASGELAHRIARDGVRFVDVAALPGGGLVATALTGPQGPMAVVRVDTASGEVADQLELAGWGELALQVLSERGGSGPAEVALRSPRGAMVLR